jgi:hypothetical protein
LSVRSVGRRHDHIWKQHHAGRWSKPRSTPLHWRSARDPLIHRTMRSMGPPRRHRVFGRRWGDVGTSGRDDPSRPRCATPRDQKFPRVGPSWRVFDLANRLLRASAW